MRYDQPIDQVVLESIRQKYLQLDALLTQDGFVQDSQGNRHTASGVYLDYHYRSLTDGRMATIKFKLQTTEVILTMRSPL